jgi:hypothetical protein
MEISEIKMLAKAMGLYANNIAEHFSFNLRLNRGEHHPRVNFCAFSISQTELVCTYTRLMRMNIQGDQEIIGIHGQRDLEYCHSTQINKWMIPRYILSLYEEVLKMERKYYNNG